MRIIDANMEELICALLMGITWLLFVVVYELKKLNNKEDKQ